MLFCPATILGGVIAQLCTAVQKLKFKVLQLERGLPRLRFLLNQLVLDGLGLLASAGIDQVHEKVADLTQGGPEEEGYFVDGPDSPGKDFCNDIKQQALHCLESLLQFTVSSFRQAAGLYL